MSVIRVNKTNDYTVMSNSHFREKEMSLKAKGLLSLMLSLPDNWDYSVAGLTKICKENTSSIENALKELKQYGYLIVTKKNPNETKSGRFEYIYDIYEKPFTVKQADKKQVVENLPIEIQGVENQAQYNTNKSNTNKSSIKNEIINIINGFSDDEKTRELLSEWLQVRKAKRTPNTPSAIKRNVDKLDALASESRMPVNDYLDEVIRRSWAAFYPITDSKKTFKNADSDDLNGVFG